jgi:hypothetical protein
MGWVVQCTEKIRPGAWRRVVTHKPACYFWGNMTATCTSGLLAILSGIDKSQEFTKMHFIHFFHPRPLLDTLTVTLSLLLCSNLSLHFFSNNDIFNCDAPNCVTFLGIKKYQPQFTT